MQLDSVAECRPLPTMPGREKNESPFAGLRRLQSSVEVQVIMWNEFCHFFLPFGCGFKFGERGVGLSVWYHLNLCDLLGFFNR